MNAKSFPRGVHPPDSKQFAEDAAIEVLPTPATLQIPLLQHLGAPCKEVLKPRSEVEAGTLLGEAAGFICAPIHCSAKGTTAKVGSATLANGRRAPAVPIKVDPEQPIKGQALFDDVLGGDWPLQDIDKQKPEDIVEAALDAGIVGLGGAAFPTHVKLRKNPDKPIDTLLINGAECEPYLTADYRVMLEAPAPVIAGALLAKHATGAQHVIIGVEDNKPKAIEAMRKAAKGTSVVIQPLHTKYPQGGEKQLIYAVTGKKAPTGGLPLDVGVVVMNIGTCAALARAVLRHKPLTHRVVTISGAGIKNPKNLLVPIGTSIQVLIDYCGGLTTEKVRVISGGPMMGFAIGDLNAPVTKGTSGITVLTDKEIARAEETACIRCGRCVDVCPLDLVPTKLALAARFENTEVAAAYHLMACMECGSCAYVCPASIPLVQLIRLGKAQARKQDAKK